MAFCEVWRPVASGVVGPSDCVCDAEAEEFGEYDRCSWSTGCRTSTSRRPGMWPRPSTSRAGSGGAGAVRPDGPRHHRAGLGEAAGLETTLPKSVEDLEPAHQDTPNHAGKITEADERVLENGRRTTMPGQRQLWLSRPARRIRRPAPNGTVPTATWIAVAATLS